MINSRQLEDLDPVVRAVCQQHIDLCKAAGIELIICSTYRDYEEQDSLYAIGRTDGTTNKHVTNAKAGQSFHNFRAAWDAVPLVRGKADWNANDPVFQQMIALAREAGVECGADWKTFKDMDHFQVRPRSQASSAIPAAFITESAAKELFDQHGTIFT